ncbi:hypothetical protein MAR_000782 [Mya arenaria]|uniref:Uncharacterized protein n=1 Tax=Mya arenaria TaxID=6604 RepID=A0ABY7FC54_MYAAR|nr:hypothetical protein MAR_000782 [Mya arenaria]
MTENKAGTSSSDIHQPCNEDKDCLKIPCSVSATTHESSSATVMRTTRTGTTSVMILKIVRRSAARTPHVTTDTVTETALIHKRAARMTRLDNE